MRSASRVETVRGKLKQVVIIRYLAGDERALKSITRLESLGFKIYSQREIRIGPLCECTEMYQRDFNKKLDLR